MVPASHRMGWSELLPNCFRSRLSFDVNKPEQLTSPNTNSNTLRNMTAILVHPTSLSLATIPYPSRSSSSSPAFEEVQLLPLPNRFPSQAPNSTSAANGNTFIWASSTVWEYDALGRRRGELTAPTSCPVEAVAAFERGVAVAAGGKVHVYRRGGGGGAQRWVLTHTLDIQERVTCMGAGDGVLVVCSEEVAAFALESGVRLDLPAVDVEMVSLTAGRGMERQREETQKEPEIQEERS